MKHYFIPGALLLLLANCGGNSSSDSSRDSLQHTDSAALQAANIAAAEAVRADSIRLDSIQKEESAKIQKEADNTKIEAFMRNYYDNYLLGNGDEDRLKKHFSKSVLSRLRKIYDEEWGESGAAPGYAFYVMRGDSQDPMGKMIDFTPMDDGWYRIKFTEDDFAGGYTKYSILIQAKVENGEVIITDYKNPKPI